MKNPSYQFAMLTLRASLQSQGLWIIVLNKANETPSAKSFRGYVLNLWAHLVNARPDYRAWQIWLHPQTLPSRPSLFEVGLRKNPRENSLLRLFINVRKTKQREILRRWKSWMFIIFPSTFCLDSSGMVFGNVSASRGFYLELKKKHTFACALVILWGCESFCSTRKWRVLVNSRNSITELKRRRWLNKISHKAWKNVGLVDGTPETRYPAVILGAYRDYQATVRSTEI